MIDKATVERIKEAANIVDVVSEFVTLRKSGANFKGLCPFHDEKTPSFMVSPARGMCHCFGCGKGGNPISFIMEHEQMTYPEALRWLANKYHIEIKERELTEDEKREQGERESMFIVNDWAAKYFEDTLHNHADGVAIGLEYFRSRGFRDDIITKFRLGYDLNNREALPGTAISKGYREEFLVKTGLCYRRDDGVCIDRFAGRVIFPWFGVSGKVVGFGGRLLDSRTKGVQQKYVNSPDSEIYHKDRELYGIFQAKKAIAKEDCVYMVEGYTDVVSMHQCGIENVVANSGTALSVHQIHTLHRFTSNIVLLYDGDEAGIHAALRGTDMLLAEGMNVKVLLFPDGDDPDSFARKHSAEDFKRYINEHQTDFIEYKSRLLLSNVTDSTKQSEAITSIVKSISLISDHVLRSKYIHECSIKQNIPESTLINTMNEFVRNTNGQQSDEERRRQEQALVKNLEDSLVSQTSKVERMLVQLIVCNGERIIFRDVEDEGGEVHNLTVAQAIQYNLATDNLAFQNHLFARILDEAVERSLHAGFKAEPYFIHHDDIEISKIATEMAMENYQLIKNQGENKVDNQNEEAQRQTLENEEKELQKQTLHLLMDFRRNYLEQHLKELQTAIAQAGNTPERQMQLMAEYQKMQHLRNEVARQLGSEIIL
ncbi:DNA primase [Hoylesella saccharolytica]|uniref:DNA primase n=1 Tax=Hoylesella saccharolytica TaxID=633701 RepID=UPI0028E3376B|nr:DNA primase [Hoylesella saccharolytica]